jgi:hypothetical protein
MRGIPMMLPAPYGFHYEPYEIDGIHTKRLVENPEELVFVKKIYEMYALPQTTYVEIKRYLDEHGVRTNGKCISQPTLKRILSDPAFVLADQSIFEYYKSHGATIVNSASEYIGTNGCYLFKGRDVNTQKYIDPAGHTLVLAPHNGVIPADLWLVCRKKLDHIEQMRRERPARTVPRTWLSKKLQCASCGSPMMIRREGDGQTHLHCIAQMRGHGCPGVGRIVASELEATVFNRMQKRAQTQHLPSKPKKVSASTTEYSRLRQDLVKVRNEIETLMASLSGANELLVSYAKEKAASLEKRQQELQEKINMLEQQQPQPILAESLLESLEQWDTLCLEQKRDILDELVISISVSQDKLQIKWKR